MKRLLRITSHAGHARYLATLDQDESGCAASVGWIVRRPEIETPYASSPTHTVYRDPVRGLVIIAETSHKRYDVFAVPPTVNVYRLDDDATAAFITERTMRTV